MARARVSRRRDPRSDVFLALADRGVRDRPAELGAFSPESLYVRYSFDRQDLIDAMERLGSGPIGDPVKTVMHESTHLFHTLTTPFGFLVYSLRRLQAFCVQNAVNHLRMTRRLQVRIPLADFIRRQPREIRDEVEPLLGMWYEAELFILFALDGFAAWNAQLLHNPYLRGMTTSQLFDRTQRWLVRLYRDHEWALHERSGNTEQEWTPPLGDYVPDEFSPSSDDFMLITLGNLMDDLNMIFITESAGTVAESWGDRSHRAQDVWERFERTFEQRGLGNLVGTHILRGMGAKLPSADFVLSYLALCELALSGPVLPHHQGLRRPPHDRLDELIPFLRWWRLVGATSQVEPMRSPAEYERFTGELCEVLGWVPPRDIQGVIAEGRNVMPNDQPEAVFVESARYRLAYPAIFTDFAWVLTGEGEENKRFLSLFNFPVVQYRDRTVYLRDKDMLLAWTRWHLLRQALRTMFLRDHVEVRVPYRPRDEMEVAFLRHTLHDDLRHAIGLDVKQLRLTLPSRAN